MQNITICIIEDIRDKCIISNIPNYAGRALLTPTRLYTEVFRKVAAHVLGAAHITGGGVLGNAARMLPLHLGLDLDMSKWIVPLVFLWIAGQGRAEAMQRFRTAIFRLFILQRDLLYLVNANAKGYIRFNV